MRTNRVYTQLCCFLGVFGLLLTHAWGLGVLPSHVLEDVMGANWVAMWFYPLVWWSFIVFLDGCNSAHGRSILSDRSLSFLPYVTACSAVIWYLFEAYNLYLANWFYVNIPVRRSLRWFGATISFATVLPGMWVVKRSVAGVIPDFVSERASWSTPGSIRTLLLLIGLVGAIGPFLLPTVFFPFVWGGLLLVLEWIEYRHGRDCFWGQCESGNYKQVLSWLMAGLICGFLWEFWNYLALGGWRYTVPGMGNLRLFEMPVIGYLGFPPFALMTWRLYESGTRYLRPKCGVKKVMVWIALGLFCVLVLRGMDFYTMVYTYQPLNQFVGWSTQEKKVIEQEGPEAFRKSTMVVPIVQSVQEKLLFVERVPFGMEGANCFWKQGLRSFRDIDQKSTKELARVLNRCKPVGTDVWYRRVLDWKQRRD
ncbi:MAG: hypothetical protein ABEJ65_08550 [bacterium]